MTNPIDNPTAYNAPKIDGELMPGIWKIVAGGKREQEYQEQQQPNTTGPAGMNLRYEHAARVTYAVKLWLKEHFEAWKVLIAKLNAGKDERPPRVYTLNDLRLEHNKIRRIAYEWCGPQEDGDQVGTYVYQLSFVEKPLVKQNGGALKSPSNPREELITRLSAENQVLSGALDNMNTAQRLKK